MTLSTRTAAPGRAVRRLVLGTAVVLAMLVAGALPVAAVDAQAQAASASASSGSAENQKSSTSTSGDAAAAKDDPQGDSAAASSGKGGAGSTSSTHEPSIVVEKRGKRVTVTGVSDEDEMERFFRRQPAMAGMIVGVVAIIFLSPVLLVALVIWYRMRKARMANETMLKLAERGVVPSAEAMQALGAGQVPPMAMSATAGASVIDQAREVRKRAAWSDLRKGVILAALGVAFTLHGIIDEGSASMVGLILLFMGVAFCALWWYETRHYAPSATASAPRTDGT